MDQALKTFINRLRINAFAVAFCAVLFPTILVVYLHAHFKEHGPEYFQDTLTLWIMLLAYLLWFVVTVFYSLRWTTNSITGFIKRREQTESIQREIILQKEAHLQRQVRFLETLIDTISSPVFYKDANLVYLGCNRAFEDSLGLKKEDIIGKTVFDIAPPPLAEVYHKADLELLSQGHRQIYEAKVRYADGTTHDVVFFKSVFPDQEGKAAGIVGVMLDVTEQRRMQGIISAHETLYKRIFYESPLGKTIIDVTTSKLRDVNEAFCQMLGYSKEELIGMFIRDITYEDDWEISSKTLQTLLEGKQESITFQKRYLKKDGSVLWAKVHLSLLTDAYTGEVYALGTVEDISREKKALEDLQLFRSALNKASESILIIDPIECSIVDVNQRACKVYGYNLEEFRSKRLIDIQPHISQSETWKHFEAVISSPEEGIIIETTHIDSKGREFPAEVSFSSTMFLGRPIVVCVIRDITEREKLKYELIKARERALEASRLKSEFVANMSHEIRTPLNGIIGIIELLSSTELNSDQQDLLKTLSESSNMIMKIINDVLDFSKIEAGKISIDHEEFHIANLVETSVEMLSVKAIEKGLSLTSYIDNNLPDTLAGPVNRLRQVLINLIGNAIKFTEKGYVSVKASLDPKQDEFNRSLNLISVLFEVEDSGVGMDEAAQKRLFMPFVQADGSFSRQYQGTGLGLYISKRLVELMGGDISISSCPNKGTTIRFSVPLLLTASPIEAKDQLTFRGRGLRALLVSDRPKEAEVIGRYLTDFDIAYSQVNDCAEGLSALEMAYQEDRPFELALFNMTNPCKDSCPMLDKREAEVKLQKTKNILITFQEGRYQLPSHIMRFDGFIKRPVKRHQLFYAISELLSEGRPVRVDKHKEVKDELPVVEGSKGFTILLVEDNPINQKVALMQLGKLGYMATVANNGHEALDLLAKRPYDLILMDCQMPVMDGFEVTRKIREKETVTGIHTPIIAMTANAMEGYRERCISAGMDDYLSKPTNLKELKEKLDYWLLKPQG